MDAQDLAFLHFNDGQVEHFGVEPQADECVSIALRDLKLIDLLVSRGHPAGLQASTLSRTCGTSVWCVSAKLTPAAFTL